MMFWVKFYACLLVAAPIAGVVSCITIGARVTLEIGAVAAGIVLVGAIGLAIVDTVGAPIRAAAKSDMGRVSRARREPRSVQSGRSSRPLR